MKYTKKQLEEYNKPISFVMQFYIIGSLIIWISLMYKLLFPFVSQFGKLAYFIFAIISIPTGAIVLAIPYIIYLKLKEVSEERKMKKK